MALVTLKDLHSTEYEHPLDRAALNTLRKIPLFPKILELCDIPQNTIARMELLGSNIRVSDKQMPSLYKILRKTCDALEMEEPMLYVSSVPELNAYTACPDKPIICMYGSLLDMMDENELAFVIGHELAHIKSHHITYQSLGAILAENLLETALSMIPGLSTVAGPAIMAINYAYYEWYRAAELTCDRGGLLACQDFKASCSALMKLAGGNMRFAKELNLDEFIAQSKTFQEAGSDNMGKLQKIILSNGRSHPWAVSRVHELIKFKDSGLYDQVLARTAPRQENVEIPGIDTKAIADKTKEAAKGAFTSISKGFGKFGKKDESAE
ncbi:MAG: M48 family metallopeptidase [Lactobacillales bacterium]|jgi:Zn-dependent protease with chaperone function|nr:M48 family metallopeptidase [Lactobacillales bacterium]